MVGIDLPDGKELGVGPAMAVAVEGRHAYILQGAGEGAPGRLLIADVTDPADPAVIGELAGLPCGRQIVVRDGLAFFTARWHGAFIADVADPKAPRLLCHYDSIECATGIGLSGRILFVTNRAFGVELVDVTDPAKPVHLSTVRTGEAQSVAARDGAMYAGVWETSEVVVADVRDPLRPQITARLPLDGYGDGVCVRGKRLYASTGHHARQLGLPHERTVEMFRKNEGTGAPGFGGGHGLELFDLSDPFHPVFLSRVKFPTCYRPANDFWSAVVSGDMAFCADTHNGLFVVNVKDPGKPACVARKRLQQVKGPDWLLRPGETTFEGVVAGVAVADGFVYVAGAYTDLHVIPAPGMARRSESEPDEAPAPPRARPVRSPGADRAEGYRLYRPYGQVRSVCFMDDLALVAAGMGGFRVARLMPDVEEVAAYRTEGVAYDVGARNGFAYVAEGEGGLTIWEHKGGGEFLLQGRSKGGRHAIVRQVMVPPPGRYALLQIGGGVLRIVDVSDADRPAEVLSEWRAIQMHDLIGHGLLDGRLVCMYGILGGVFWYDLASEPKPVCVGESAADPWGRGGLAQAGDRFLFTAPGGYRLIGPEDRDVRRTDVFTFANGGVVGKPRVYGSRLYLSDRLSGTVELVDISDLRRPRPLKRIVTAGNPGGIVEHCGAVVLPDGYEGMRIYDTVDAFLRAPGG